MRLKNKEKLRGRLGVMREDGFDMQVAAGDKIETRTIAFNELKSIKKAEGGGAGHVAGNIAVGTLAVIGGLVVTLIIIAVVAGG